MSAPEVTVRSRDRAPEDSSAFAPTTSAPAPDAVLVLAVRGLHCPGCAAGLGRALAQQAGVAAAAVDFLRAEVRVTLAPDADAAAVRAALATVLERAGVYLSG